MGSRGRGGARRALRSRTGRTGSRARRCTSSHRRVRVSRDRYPVSMRSRRAAAGWWGSRRSVSRASRAALRRRNWHAVRNRSRRRVRYRGHESAGVGGPGREKDPGVGPVEHPREDRDRLVRGGGGRAVVAEVELREVLPPERGDGHLAEGREEVPADHLAVASGGEGRAGGGGRRAGERSQDSAHDSLHAPSPRRRVAAAY